MRHAIFEEDHDRFREVVRGSVDRVLAPNADRCRACRAIDRDAWMKAGEQGLLGFTVPERFGGGGTSGFRFNAVLGEELARLGHSYASSFGIITDVVSPYLLELTTEQ